MAWALPNSIAAWRSAVQVQLARLDGLPVFVLYSYYLEPDTDVATFAPAMELGASFGAKYATVMGADTDWSRQRDNFVATCDLAQPERLAKPTFGLADNDDI